MFDEFFIINLINFKLFKKKTYKNEYSNSVMLPYNFKIITPVNEYELNKLLINKNLVAFAGLGKSLSGLRIQFLIKKYNVRLIYLQNIGGVGNQYLGKQYTGYRKTRLIRNNRRVYTGDGGIIRRFGGSCKYRSHPYRGSSRA